MTNAFIGLPVDKHFSSRLLTLPGHMATAAKLAAADIVYDPATLKRDGFIASTIVQSALRIALSFSNEKTTQDPSQKELRFREFIRTTLREIIGCILSYGVMRKVSSMVLGLLNLLQGVEAPVNTIPTGFSRFVRDVKAMGNAFLDKKALPKLEANRLETLEKTVAYVPNMTSALGRWMTRQTENGLFKGKNPANLMRLTREWLPVSIGSAVAVALSGFWLEWLTIHKSEQVVNVVTDQIKKHRPRPKGIPDFNASEFVGGVMEERWRRQQVDEPWFAGRRLNSTP